jgi:hypothetical protein
MVFWFDTDKEFRVDFEQLMLDGVERIKLLGNGFGENNLQGTKKLSLAATRCFG